MNPDEPGPDTAAAIEKSVRGRVRYSLGRTLADLSPRELLVAVALSVRDRLLERLLETEERYARRDAKRLAYLSIECLAGRSLRNCLYSLGLRDPYARLRHGLGFSLQEVEEAEEDAALGNGGLGRLAACFLDSLATLDMPVPGHYPRIPAVPRRPARAAAQIRRAAHRQPSGPGRRRAHAPPGGREGSGLLNVLHIAGEYLALIEDRRPRRACAPSPARPLPATGPPSR